MVAFPGVDVREKAVGSCVEQGQRRLVIPTQTDSFPSLSWFNDRVPSVHLFLHTSDPSPVHPDQGSSDLMSFSIEDVQRQSIYLLVT
jgi:hypothetical protein